MPVTVGSRLGHYEILAPLGAGGMGEVYRARDVRLRREVAVKVIGAQLAATPELRQRFEREARVVAALSHPHICTLFDVGSHEGDDFLVMELLEGEPLSDRLARGRLPLDQALRFAAQILDALAKAHKSGIVHRDLKPANVMLTPGGVKLLDFGLAQLRSEPTAGLSVSVGPTRPAPLTGEGALLGTLQYMAPEQLEGRAVDGRTDLFAFGAVLYEMVTGAMAFPGSTVASVISSVLRDEPPPLRERNPLAPVALERLVARCLAKDPEERWQSAHDLRLQLQTLGELGSGSSIEARPAEPSRAGGPAVLPGRAAVPRRAAIAGALLLAILAGGLGLVAGGRWGRPPALPPAPTVRLEVPPPAGKIFFLWVEGVSLALSPDGRTLAFVAWGAAASEAQDQDDGSAIWLRSLDDLEPRRLAGSDGATSLLWSPDGQEIAFFGGGRLRRMRLDGAAPVVLTEVPGWIGYAGIWGPEGIVYATVQGDGLYLVPAAGGEPTLLRGRDETGPEARLQWPQLAPDGTTLLYLASQTGGDAQLRLWRRGQEPITVAAMQSRFEWLGPRHLAFVRDGALVAQEIDLEAGRLLGVPVPIAPVVNSFRASRGAAFAASRAGTLALMPHYNEAYLGWFDRSGRPLGQVGKPGSARGRVRISPDGRQALSDAFTGRDQSLDISLIDLERDVETPLISTPGTDAFPTWLPDGKGFIYTSSQGRPPQLRRRDFESGADEPVLLVDTFQVPDAITRDGVLLFHQRTMGAFELFSLPLGTPPESAEPTAIFVDPMAIDEARLSPDDALLAFTSGATGRFEAYVRPLASAAAPLRISAEGATSLAWSPDGRELFYVAADNRLLAAAIERDPLRVGRSVELFPLPGLDWTSFDVAPDGRILAIVESAHANRQPLTVVSGWRP